MTYDELLAEGWEWSVRKSRSKVKRGETYMEVSGNQITYVAGRNSGIHGDWNMGANSFPLLKMILLTYHEEEIRETIRRQLR